MEKDFISSTFFSDNERYADIINGIGCNGIPFVKGEDLQEVDTKVLFGRDRRFGKRRKKRTADYSQLPRLFCTMEKMNGMEPEIFMVCLIFLVFQRI